MQLTIVSAKILFTYIGEIEDSSRRFNNQYDNIALQALDYKRMGEKWSRRREKGVEKKK